MAKAIKEKIEANIYPRLFIITENVQILPSKKNESEIVQTIYNFNNIDFRDKITGIPYQYDIYVQKIKVKSIKPKHLFIDTSGDDDFTTHYVVSSIVINNMLGNDPTKAGVTLYFKVDGTTQIIYITYNNFNDILNDLGSYFAIFDLVAKLFAMFYADFFLQADLLNSVFCFNEYDVRRPKNGNKLSSHTDNSEDSSFSDNNSKSNKRNSSIKEIPSMEVPNKQLIKSSFYHSDNKDSNFENIELVYVGGGKKDQKEITYLNEDSKIQIGDDICHSTEKPINNKDIDYSKKDNKITRANKLMMLNSNTDEIYNTNPSHPNLKNSQNNTSFDNPTDKNIKIDNLIKQDQQDNKSIRTDEIVENDNYYKGIKKKYKILLNSLSFNEENKLENNIINKYDVTPYDLMFECCYKKYDPRKKAKYELYKKCLSILEKTMNIEYIIRKDMEVNFIKEYLLNQTENNMFKYHFKPLNVLNFDDSMDHLKKLKSEGVQCLTKDELINEVLNGNNKIFEVFFDYHAN